MVSVLVVLAYGSMPCVELLLYDVPLVHVDDVELVVLVLLSSAHP